MNKLFSQKKPHDRPQLAVGKAEKPQIHIGPLKIFTFVFVLYSKALVINPANPPGSGQWGIALATSTPEPGGGSWHQDLRLSEGKVFRRTQGRMLPFPGTLLDGTDGLELGAGGSWAEEGALTP